MYPQISNMKWIYLFIHRNMDQLCFSGHRQRTHTYLYIYIERERERIEAPKKLIKKVDDVVST